MSETSMQITKEIKDRNIITTLPVELFYYIYSYVSLLTNICTFPLLKKIFNPSKQFLKGNLVIDLRYIYSNFTRFRSFRHIVNRVFALDLRLRQLECDQSSAPLRSVVQAICGNIKTLCVRETFNSIHDSGFQSMVMLLSDYQRCENKREINLCELKVQIKSDFRCLLGPSLRTLILEIPWMLCFGNLKTKILQFLNQLPSSLTYLDIGLGYEQRLDAETLEALTLLFRNPNWLPNIRHFQTPVRTIMNSTGTYRPYEWLCLLCSHSETLKHPSQHLKKLKIDSITQDGHTFLLFDDMTSTSLPDLQSFEIFAKTPKSICDLNPMLVYLSHRPLEYLTIDMSLDCKNNFVPLSDVAWKALSEMSKLISLNLKSDCVDNDSIMKYITPRCWPALKKLSLGFKLSWPVHQAFVLAAPAVREIVRTWQDAIMS